MRKIATVALVCLLAASAATPVLAESTPAELKTLKSGGPLGLGFGVGTTIGASLKVWPVYQHAMVFHIGVPPILNSMALHLSYRFHLPPLRGTAAGPAFSVQLGPAFRSRFVFSEPSVFAELGGGLVVGVSVTFPAWPIEFFAEVQPTFGGSATNPPAGLGFTVEGVAGIRFYLGKPRRQL